MLVYIMGLVSEVGRHRLSSTATIFGELGGQSLGLGYLLRGHFRLEYVLGLDGLASSTCRLYSSGGLSRLELEHTHVLPRVRR